MGTVRAPPPATTSPGHIGSYTHWAKWSQSHLLYVGQGKNTAKIFSSTHLSEERIPPLLLHPPPGVRGGGRRRGGRQRPVQPARQLHRPGGGRGRRGPGAGPAGAPGQPAQRCVDYRGVNEPSQSFRNPGKASTRTFFNGSSV